MKEEQEIIKKNKAEIVNIKKNKSCLIPFSWQHEGETRNYKGE